MSQNVELLELKKRFAPTQNFVDKFREQHPLSVFKHGTFKANFQKVNSLVIMYKTFSSERKNPISLEIVCLAFATEFLSFDRGKD